ncbi:MAG: SMC-Scp complex subunit ScpB [Candidatus Krumholzibacteriia bacterium]
MEPSRIDSIVLALLFASDEPISMKRISAIVDAVELDDLKDAVTRLQKNISRDYPSIVLERVAGGLQLATNPEFADYVSRLYSGRRKQRLSRAAMETLAIIAYKQPITRADIENLRGVGCGGVLTTLMERNLIRIAGKARVLGAPFLYGTTPEFLEYLGLDRLKDLPSMEVLEEMLAQEESPAEEKEDGDEEAGPTLEDFTMTTDTAAALDSPDTANHGADAADHIPRADNPD